MQLDLTAHQSRVVTPELLARDQAIVVRLLRIAEYLERSKSGVVRNLRVGLSPEKALITVQAVGDATVEVWEANRRTGLFEKSFGRAAEIVIAS